MFKIGQTVFPKTKNVLALLLASGFKHLTGQSLDALIHNDRTTAVQWDVSDLDFILNRYRKINLLRGRENKPEKTKLIQELEGFTTRAYNDQTIYDDNSKKARKPLTITSKNDKITLPGLARSSELITDESRAYFNYFAVGTSQQAADLGDWRLYAEVARSDLAWLGFKSGTGNKITHSGVFLPGVPSADIYENAPVDTPEFSEDQTIWARAVFPANKPIPHILGLDFFTSTHTTEQISGQ
jgi:hypothetical protein